MSLLQYMDEHRARVDAALLANIPKLSDGLESFAGALAYPLEAGGKRVRPLLVIAACEALGGDLDHALPGAVAVEYLHTYSLVHDDLPAMDNDDLRRGRPTLHKVHGDAIAILAGDALHTLAFEILATQPHGDEWMAVRAHSCAVLARAAGSAGMVGGQVLDLAWEEKPCDAATLAGIHRRKTGALLQASLELGALVARSDEDDMNRMRTAGAHIGQLFQIVDDILDVTGTTAELGKTAGKDAAAQKATYVSIHGMERARTMAAEEAQHAHNVLDPLGAAAIRLHQLVDFIHKRTA